MNRFRESDLTLSFPPDWVVLKYDDSPAYQSVSGHGLKGVDFLALAPGGGLWFVEVKNYRPRYAGLREYRAHRRPPEALARHVLRKFADSRRLVRIVDRALRRRWWTRLQLWFLDRRPATPRPGNRLWFWTEAHRRLATPANHRYVLWLETPETARDYDDAVAAALKSKLDPAEVRVLDTDSQHSFVPSPIHGSGPRSSADTS